MKFGKRLLAVILAGALLTGCTNVEISDNPVGMGDSSEIMSGMDMSETDIGESSESAGSEYAASGESEAYDSLPEETDGDDSGSLESSNEREAANTSDVDNSVSGAVGVVTEGGTVSVYDGSAPVQTSAGSSDKKPDSTAAKPTVVTVGNGKLSEKGSGREGSTGKGSYITARLCKRRLSSMSFSAAGISMRKPPAATGAAIRE